jgi:hypothetical protein
MKKNKQVSRYNDCCAPRGWGRGGGVAQIRFFAAAFRFTPSPSKHIIY